MNPKIKILAGFGQTPESAAMNVEELYQEWTKANPNAQVISTEITATDTASGDGFYSNVYLKIEYREEETK